MMRLHNNISLVYLLFHMLHDQLVYSYSAGKLTIRMIQSLDRENFTVKNDSMVEANHEN